MTHNVGLNEKNWEKTKSFIGKRYVQHNLAAIDGPEGLKAHIEFLKRDFPKKHVEIKHVLADGDLAALHRLSEGWKSVDSVPVSLPLPLRAHL